MRSEAEFELVGGPFDRVVIRGLDDSGRGAFPNIVFESSVVRCRENLEYEGGFHIPGVEAIRDSYEFDYDPDDPCFRYIGRTERPDTGSASVERAGD